MPVARCFLETAAEEDYRVLENDCHSPIPQVSLRFGITVSYSARQRFEVDLESLEPPT